MTQTQLETYGINTSKVSEYLEKGYWHSAYFELDAYTPEAVMQMYHDDLKSTIKTYVNTNYESYFNII